MAVSINGDGVLSGITTVSSDSITSAGNISLTNGNLIFSTAGTGIDFSATSDSSGTMSSELLDDYEVGTWTGTIFVNGTSTGVSQSDNTYVKIGKLVFCRYKEISNVTAGTDGVLEIRGLPFVSENTPSSAVAPGSIFLRRNGSNTTDQVTCFVDANSSAIKFEVLNSSASSVTGANASEIINIASSNVNYIFCTVVYRTD